MTQTNPTMPATTASSDNDQLLHLHKMSTTAGVGSQEYVAVNVTAVVAMLFGLASLLAIASPVLLVFPVVGVGLSWIALRQVRRSNGTQTGGGLAILGLVLSGVITATLFSYEGLQAWRRSADEKALAALSQKFGDLMSQGNYADAYVLFDSDFQNRVNKEAFVAQLTSVQHRMPMVPPIDGIRWNGLAVFQTNDDGGESADAVVKLHYKGYDAEERGEARFRRGSDGSWQIDNIPDFFPAPKPGADAAAAGPK